MEFQIIEGLKFQATKLSNNSLNEIQETEAAAQMPSEKQLVHEVGPNTDLFLVRVFLYSD